MKKKPVPNGIRIAGEIRKDALEATKARDFAIKEARRKYAERVNTAKRSRRVRYMRGQLAYIRERIYRVLRAKYPNMTQDKWELVYKFIHEYICTDVLMGENRSTQKISIETLYRNGKTRIVDWSYDNCIEPELGRVIIDAFRMARKLCKGVLIITVAHPECGSCIIRVR